MKKDDFMKGLKYTAFILLILFLLFLIVYGVGVAMGRFDNPFHAGSDLPGDGEFNDSDDVVGDDCTDFDIGEMFNKAATPRVIDAWESQCEGIGGVWTESSDEISCYWNPAVVSVDCNGVGTKTMEHYCEDVLLATWYCDNGLAFVGCLCEKDSPYPWESDGQCDGDDEEGGDGVCPVDCASVVIPTSVGDKGAYCEEYGSCTDTAESCAHYWLWNEQVHKCGCTETFYCGQYCYEYYYTNSCECPPGSYKDIVTRSTFRCIPDGYTDCDESGNPVR